MKDTLKFDLYIEVINIYKAIEIITILLALAGGIYIHVNKEKLWEEIERKKKEKESRSS